MNEKRNSQVRNVFLSSTGGDLTAYRKAAYEAIQGLDDWKCVRMEDFGARDWDVDTFCRAKVQECDLFIGIIGNRFGSGPKGSKDSYTQREYQAARDAHRPVLLFLASDDFPVPGNLLEPMTKVRVQRAFRARVRNGGDRIVDFGFTSAEDLAKRVVSALYHFVRESPGGRKPPDATDYLKFLWDDTAYIDIRGLSTTSEDVYRFRIDELYTPLTTVAAPENPKSEHQSVPLQRALENRCVVLVGDPGAGKSTFLRRIAFASCETLLGRNPAAAAELLPAGSGRFPLLIRAASLSNHIQRNRREGPADADSPEWVIRYLEAEAQGRNRSLDAAFFREQLNSGCLLLMDGLDEATDRTNRKDMARLLELLARSYDRTQVVATSRPPAYGGESVIPGFETIWIQPLDEEAIATFIGKWCRALHRGNEEKAREHEQELLSAIQSKPEIQDMAVNPVMLTAIAALHWNKKRLPDQRTELYESILKWLAQAREEKRKETRVPAKQCLELMEHLAFSMHSDPKGKGVEITRHAAARLLAPRFRELPEEERGKAAERFLEQEETDSGILVSRGNTLRYWHQTFQEYLAARALLWREADRTRLLFREGKIYDPAWRETVLLLAGLLCERAPEPVDELLSQIFEGLGAEATLEQRARCAGLVGRIVQDLMSWKYVIADARHRENLTLILPVLFDADTARRVKFETRLEAADALGQAGDPRLERENWVRITGGQLLMGAQNEDPNAENYDPEAYPDESPVRRVTLPDFYIGRYPVTVFEYERFIAAGGYKNEQFWKEGGYGKFGEPREWRRQLAYPSRPVTG
jgi:hypothetical protein